MSSPPRLASLLLLVAALAGPAHAATVCRVLRGLVLLPQEQADGGDDAQVRRVPLPNVDPARSLLLFSSRGAYGDVSGTRVRGELAATEAVFTRADRTGALITVLWTVAEFCSGVRVQRGVEATNSNTLIAVTPFDPARSLVTASAAASPADYNTDSDNYYLAMPEDGATVRVQHGRTLYSMPTAWQLFESDGLAVQRTRVAMNEGVAVVDAFASVPAEAFGRVTWRGLVGTSQSEEFLVTATVSGGRLRVERGSDGGAVEVNAELLRFTDGTRVHAGRAVINDGRFALSVTLPAPADPDRSVAFLAAHEQFALSTSGGPVAGAVTSRLIDGTTLELERATANGDTVADWVVLEFVGADGGTPPLPADAGTSPAPDGGVADGGDPGAGGDAGSAALAFLSTPPGTASCNVPWTYTPTVQAPGRVSFSVRAPGGGEVPGGLFVNSDTGALLLRSPEAGQFSFELVAASNGSVVTQPISLDVMCEPLAVGCGCGGPLPVGALAALSLLVGSRRRRR